MGHAAALPAGRSCGSVGSWERAVSITGQKRWWGAGRGPPAPARCGTVPALTFSILPPQEFDVLDNPDATGQVFQVIVPRSPDSVQRFPPARSRLVRRLLLSGIIVAVNLPGLDADHLASHRVSPGHDKGSLAIGAHRA